MQGHIMRDESKDLGISCPELPDMQVNVMHKPF